jgi:crossover junction endodeoxyribonuclease RusA
VEENEMITIELPWPDKRLNPNSRPHWAVKAKAAKEANSVGYWEAYKAWDNTNNAVYAYSIKAQYTLHPPDKRRRDIDNFLSATKNYVDGVFAHLNVDDSCIQQTIVEWGEPVRGGKVTLRLEEMDGT